MVTFSFRPMRATLLVIGSFFISYERSLSMDLSYRTRVRSGVLIAVMLLLAAVPLSAIDVEMPEPAVPAAGGANDWALNFQISENFTLKSFEGMMISATRHHTRSSAIRFGLDLSIASSESEDNGETIRDCSSRSVELVVHFMRYPRMESEPVLYWGIGPLISYVASEYETHAPGEPSSSQRQEGMAWAVGASGVLGVEWLVAQNVALLAEYGVSADYEKQIDEQCSDSSERESTSFNFSSSGVRFGVSVYL